jgi:hypothetical protein
MKIEQFYRSDRSAKLLPNDKTMQLVEALDRTKLEVLQLRKKVSDDTSVNFDEEKSPTASYNKKYYDEFRKASSKLRRIQDKITALDTEISKLSPDISSPSEADWCRREILVLEVTLDEKLEYFKDRMMKKLRKNLADTVRAGDGDLKRGLIAGSSKLQREEEIINDWKAKYQNYKDNENKINEIIEKICGGD